MDKTSLRRTIRELKHRCATEQLDSWSARLAIALESHPWFKQAPHILMFASLPDEPDTFGLLRKYAPQKHLYLPAVVGQEIEVRQYESEADLCAGAFGISEPAGKVLTDLSVLDLIVVPGVAFDAEGHRLGRGRGYYDRLLARPGVRARLIGYAFPFQLVETVPHNAHDISVQTVITIS